MRHLSKQKVGELIAAYAAGATVYELAERYGIHRTRVSKLIKQAGGSVRYHETAGIDLARAEELHASGISLTEVARHLGVGRSALIRARRRARELM